MESKQIGTLVELADPDLFEELAIGLKRLHAHATNLDRAAKVLFAAKEGHGAAILQVFAEEEAAKLLILLDAVRCPRQALGHHLKKFYSHLARLLYAEAVTLIGIQRFSELREYMERERKSHYLDGEVALEFVMRNQNLWVREDTLYVDYVGQPGRRYWTNPQHWEHERPLTAFWMADALVAVGMEEPGALAVLAGTWRDVAIVDDLHWSVRDAWNRKTLENMETLGLLKGQSSEIYDRIITRWQYPMYSLDLREEGGDEYYRELKRQSDASWPDDYS